MGMTADNRAAIRADMGRVFDPSPDPDALALFDGVKL